MRGVVSHQTRPDCEGCQATSPTRAMSFPPGGVPACAPAGAGPCSPASRINALFLHAPCQCPSPHGHRTHPARSPRRAGPRSHSSARPLATRANDGVATTACNLAPGLGSQRQSLRERVPARQQRYRTGAPTSSLIPGPEPWPRVSPWLSSGIAEGSWGPRMGSLSRCRAKTKWPRTAASRCPTHGRCGSPGTQGGCGQTLTCTAAAAHGAPGRGRGSIPITSILLQKL